MKSKARLKTITGVLALALAGGWAARAQAEDFLHTRSYLGLMATSAVIDGGGEFNGTLYSRTDNPYEINVIPALSRNFGLGILLGHREENYAAEVSFWLSDHTGTFGPVNLTGGAGSSNFASQAQATVSYNSVNVDFKRYFLSDMNLQPFLDLGVSFPWVTIPNSAEDAFGNVGSTSVTGLGLNLGIGAEWYLDDHFSVTATILQRWASFDRFKGSFDSQYSTLSLVGASPGDGGNGLDFTVGTTIGVY
jgi:hypothetical protein